MMFEQWVKLFNINWIQPWMVEAMAIVVGGLILMFVVCKAMDCMNGENK